MRFQNLENSKLYRLYRDDEMDRLSRKIQQIKRRKNQHMGSKQSHLLPYISQGFGFSLERKHQIEKENQRLEQKIKKAKNTHSNYYFNKIELKKSSSSKNHTSRYFQTLSGRSGERSSILPATKTERKHLQPLPLSSTRIQENKKRDKQNIPSQPQTFRKEIMRIYHESYSNLKKMPV